MPRPNLLILASESPRRRALLARLGIDFLVRPAAVRELSEVKGTPEQMVLINAGMKADQVASAYPESLVLGADTSVFLDGKALNKPADPEDARRMLRALSGREHSVLTGIALRRKGHSELKLDRCAESRVRFKTLDEATIERYLSQVNPLDKAGGYAVQEHGDLIVESLSGSHSNVVGLPLELLRELLTGQGFVCREVGR